MATATEDRTAVFVSYSRRDEAFVKRVQPMLERMGLDVWVDLEDIPPSTNWRDEIQDGIERCDTVIVVVSPDSAASVEVGKEIQRASDLGKRIVPVLYRPVDPGDTPAAVAERNWVPWLNADQTDEALDKIDRSLKIDPEWTKEHTRLNGLALTWSRRDRDRNLLIRGDGLDSAEREIVVDRPADQPQVTALMREFVTESRRHATRRQRRLVITALAVAGVSIGLAVVAWLARTEADRQRAEAVRQRDTATSAALAARSENRLTNEPDLAALLALEAYRTKDTVDALGSLLRVVDTPTTFVERHAAHDAPMRAIVRDVELGLAATGDDGGGVVLWDVFEDGAVPAAGFEVGGAITDLAVDPAAGTVAVAVDGAPVQVWTAGERPEQVEVGEYPWYTTLSPDGRLGAGMVSDDEELFLAVGEAAGARAAEIPVGLGVDEVPEDLGPPSLAFSPDSSLVAVGWDTTITVVATDAAEVVGVVDVESLAGLVAPDSSALGVESLTFLGAGDRLAVGVVEGHIYLLDLVDGGRAVPVRPLPTSEARAMSSLTAVDEEGTALELLGSAHNNGEIKLWVVDGLDAVEFATMKGHDEEALAVAVDAEGAVMSGSWDGDLIFSQAFAQAQIGVPLLEADRDTSHGVDVVDVEFAGAGLVASLDGGGVVKTWDPATGSAVATILDAGVTSIEGTDGRIVVGDDAGQVALVDPADGSASSFEPAHDAPVGLVGVSGDGELVVSADESETVWLWDVDGERIAEVDTPEGFAVNEVAFPSRDVLWIGGATVGEDGVAQAMAVRVDTGTGASIGAPVLHNADETGHFVESIAISPDGSTLATGGSDRRVFVSDVDDPTAEPRELAAHLETVDDLVFFGDDALLAADLDGAILMWDVPAGRVVGELTGPGDGVNALSVHPDGDLLVAGSEDDIVWSWDLRPGSWVDGACRLAGRNMTELEWTSLELDDEPVAHCPDQEGGRNRPPAEYPAVAEAGATEE